MVRTTRSADSRHAHGRVEGEEGRNAAACGEVKHRNSPLMRMKITWTCGEWLCSCSVKCKEKKEKKEQGQFWVLLCVTGKDPINFSQPSNKKSRMAASASNIYYAGEPKMPACSAFFFFQTRSCFAAMPLFKFNWIRVCQGVHHLTWQGRGDSSISVIMLFACVRRKTSAHSTHAPDRSADERLICSGFQSFKIRIFRDC